jgi:DNA repair photolyase
MATPHRHIPIVKADPHDRDPREPAALKGRGTAWAIASRYTNDDRSAFDDGWGTLDEQVAQIEKNREDGDAAVATQVTEQHVRSILASNESPDIPFDQSINPYRGCEHGCVYCFARPTHAYLDLSPGLDFETKLVAKINAAQRLREAFMKPRYVPKPLNIGSATDAYQPIERKLRITRSVLEVLAEFQHPFSIVTKSSGIERDLDLIAPMAAQNMAAAYVSVTTLDHALARILEPRAAAPARRIETIRRLAQAGVPVGVSVSPIIPFINEPELERILEIAREAGATSAFCIVVRLPWEISPLFRQWLDHHFPDRAARVMARIREMRGGRDNDARFGSRMVGQGVWGALLSQRFHKATKRLGYVEQRAPLDHGRFRRPRAVGTGASDIERLQASGNPDARKARPPAALTTRDAAETAAPQGSLFDDLPG